MSIPKNISLSKDWILYKYHSEWRLKCKHKCVFDLSVVLSSGDRIGPLKNCAYCNKIPPIEIITKAKLLGFK